MKDVEKAINEGIVRYDDANKNFKCVVCDIYLSGEASVSQHLQGSKHREVAFRYTIDNINNAPASLQAFLTATCIKAAETQVIKTSGAHAILCTVCNVGLTGIRQVEDHLIGDDHRKKWERVNIGGIPSQQVSPARTAPRQQDTLSSTLHTPITGLGLHQITPCTAYPVLRRPIYTAALSPNAGAAAATYAAPCYVSPSTIIQPSGLPDDNSRLVEKAFLDGIVTATDNVNERFECTICSKKFNSPATLTDHLRSKNHKKKDQGRLWSSASNSSSINSVSLHSLPESEGERGRGTYQVSSQPRGYVYVFNNKFLGQGAKWQRTGAEIDSRNLNETFTKMGYEIHLYEDLNLDQTREAFNKIRKNPKLSTIDVVILVILSHGRDAYSFYTNDQNELSLFTVRNFFTDRQCPYLKGKPKLIFTNYCRGDHLERKDLDTVQDVPSHMITLHAVSEGIMAKRSHTRGTYFVMSLCEVLRNSAHELELSDIYCELYKEMKKHESTKPMTENHGFINKFYFNPSYRY